VSDYENSTRNSRHCVSYLELFVLDLSPCIIQNIAHSLMLISELRAAGDNHTSLQRIKLRLSNG